MDRQISIAGMVTSSGVTVHVQLRSYTRAHKENKQWPNTEPCGVPQKIFCLSETRLAIKTNKYQKIKQPTSYTACIRSFYYFPYSAVRKNLSTATC